MQSKIYNMHWKVFDHVTLHVIVIQENMQTKKNEDTSSEVIWAVTLHNPVSLVHLWYYY